MHADLQPTDVTGLSIFNQRERDFEFRPGPIFANVVLVDEINRAMPKTQSALLEAMAEGQVTVDGATRPVPQPFLLLATENPIEFEGTFPLPRHSSTASSCARRSAIRGSRRSCASSRSSAPAIRSTCSSRCSTSPTCTSSAVAAQSVYVDDLLRSWIVSLVRSTRELEAAAIGSSVRGSLALESAARAWALLQGRTYVVPADVELLFTPVVMHRIVFRPSFLAEVRRVGWPAAAAQLQEDCLASAPPPGK